MLSVLIAPEAGYVTNITLLPSRSRSIKRVPQVCCGTASACKHVSCNGLCTRAVFNVNDTVTLAINTQSQPQRVGPVLTTQRILWLRPSIHVCFLRSLR